MILLYVFMKEDLHRPQLCFVSVCKHVNLGELLEPPVAFRGTAAVFGLQVFGVVVLLSCFILVILLTTSVVRLFVVPRSPSSILGSVLITFTCVCFLISSQCIYSPAVFAPHQVLRFSFYFCWALLWIWLKFTCVHEYFSYLLIMPVILPYM